MRNVIDSQDKQPIPGSLEFVEGIMPHSILLLAGPTGAGKTMYCRQFILDGLRERDICILISSSLSQRQFKALFEGITSSRLSRLRFLDPYGKTARNKKSVKLSATMEEVRRIISKSRREDGMRRSIRVAVDSLTQLLILFGEKALLRFVTELSMLLREEGSTAILTLSSSDKILTSKLGSAVDGLIEMKLQDSNRTLVRSIRLLSIKGVHHKPAWVNFTINDNGMLVFGSQSSGSLFCTLCEKPVTSAPIMYGNLLFDSKQCFDTYSKLAGVYGSRISETGLPAEVLNVNFFFIDIVGLSEPSLSVKNQVQKIEALNKLIRSCDSFAKTPKDKKIILPTGDGMAIGFLLNPEAPLKLSIELHRKLRAENRNKTAEEAIGVRIGLNSGPVFTVSDINDVQNVWGPGIIMARRVMDVGDNDHILVAEKLAEELIALKDEYRSLLKPISDHYELKHGQKMKLYSAYSHDFGNTQMPAKLRSM